MGERVRDLSEVLREGLFHREEILALLATGPKTVAEVAEGLRCTPRDAMLWLMLLRRYGEVVDVPKPPADEYYRYRRVDGAS